MKTTQAIDFFAPIGQDPLFEGLIKPSALWSPTSLLSPVQLTKNAQLRFDAANRFTYIIMGLAVLIAIVIPLLNLS